MKRIIIHILFLQLFSVIFCNFTFSSNQYTDPPVAIDDFAITNEDLQLPIDVLDNDTDPQGNIDPSTVTIIERALHGTLSVNPFSGFVIYTAEPNYNGTDSFIYEVCDTDGYCAQANVYIKINPINDSITAMDDFDTTQVNNPVTINVLKNDSDELDPLGSLDTASLVILLPPQNGSVSIDPISGTLIYTPDFDFIGTDFIAYQICDNGYPLPATCDIASVTITVNTKSSQSDVPVFVPTGFSPNGDGVNDYFVIPGLEYYPENELNVYNRWGSMVFSAKGYANTWDGISSNRMAIGEPLAVGTYFYVLTLGNGKDAITGYVYINR
jgi:gliding motility-associated-like protein